MIVGGGVQTRVVIHIWHGRELRTPASTYLLLVYRSLLRYNNEEYGLHEALNLIH